VSDSLHGFVAWLRCMASRNFELAVDTLD